MSALLLPADDADVRSAVAAIQGGDVALLSDLLRRRPELATAAVADSARAGNARTLLHVATDWPGHFARVGECIGLLVAAGAEVDAPFIGDHAETPLHWAASNNDLVAMVALLEGGANIDAPGSVLTGGAAVANARAFAQWDAARLLVERGAATTLVDEATLGLMDRLAARFDLQASVPGQDQVNAAFWGACHGGSLEAARFLFERGAEVNWLPPWERLTPLDAAVRSGAVEVVGWLREVGGAVFSKGE